MKTLLIRIGLFIEGIITGKNWPINFIVKFIKNNPEQTLAPLGVFACSIIMIIMDGTAWDPILMSIQAVLLLIQSCSIIRSAIKSRRSRLKEDKERLQQFFESVGTYRMPGSLHFLSIYKDSWLQAWYYHFRGITRLSLYKYGATDDVGSYTKFPVNTKDFFHLQLKGCIDTEDPDKAVEGINHIDKEYLTK